MIACLKCKHYFSTFDATKPRGCRLYQFQSQVMPSILVKNASGHDCESFELRKKDEQVEKKIDYLDAKYWSDSKS